MGILTQHVASDTCAFSRQLCSNTITIIMELSMLIIMEGAKWVKWLLLAL